MELTAPSCWLVPSATLTMDSETRLAEFEDCSVVMFSLSTLSAKLVAELLTEFITFETPARISVTAFAKSPNSSCEVIFKGLSRKSPVAKR